MPTHETKHRSRKVPAVAALVVLVQLSIANLKIVREPLEKFIQHDLSFEDFADEIQKGYISDNFTHKSDFVNINGLFARLIGRRTLNNVVKLNNGMLSKPLTDMDMTNLANGITSFSDHLSEQGIPFLYVQMPYKESLDGQSVPAGITFYGNKNADSLLSRLSAEKVETLDLRPLLCQTPEILEHYFHRTDHHWNSDGSFAAFQKIMNVLHEWFPEGNIDLAYAQEDQWERHSIDDWFLGSWGKRVGIFFGGTAPLIWYTPKFETEMSCAIPKHGWLYQGDFTEANIRKKFIEKKDYFGHNSYDIYTGGCYPLVQHKNLYAPSPLKVMIIQDSFTQSLQAYLSTVFQKIDIVDPREKYGSLGCTVAEYVERTMPDVVIFAINPDQFGDKFYYDFGVEETISINAEGNSYELVTQQNIEVKMSVNDQNNVAYPLETNTVYRVSFEDVDILDGQASGK